MEGRQQLYRLMTSVLMMTLQALGELRNLVKCLNTGSAHGLPVMPARTR